MQDTAMAWTTTAERETLDKELAAYNRAFCELELPWHWDADTFRQLLSAAGGEDCVGAYVERSQPHLLRVYEKTFLCDLIRDARDRGR
jgi:hypothetical protein